MGPDIKQEKTKIIIFNMEYINLKKCKNTWVNGKHIELETEREQIVTTNKAIHVSKKILETS